MRWKAALMAVLAAALAAGLAQAQQEKKPAASPKKSAPGGKKASKSPAAALAGTWIAGSGAGRLTLAFRSERQLTFQGDPAEYQLLPGVIRVLSEDGLVDYPYALDGEVLRVTFPGGEVVSFRRAAAAEPHPAAASAAPSGENRRLQGMLCTFSGSSGSGGGWYSLRKVWFDGAGRFSTGSETAASTRHHDSGGDLTARGSTYGTSKGVGGTYRVEGNRVVLTPSDGSPVEAKVHFRQADGRITELMIKGTLYGAALCE